MMLRAAGGAVVALLRRRRSQRGEGQQDHSPDDGCSLANDVRWEQGVRRQQRWCNHGTQPNEPRDRRDAFVSGGGRDCFTSPFLTCQSATPAFPRVRVSIMDFGESDDEGLPTHADSTTHSLEADLNTSSSFPSSGLIDQSLPIQEPPSPGTARKRGTEEVYVRSQAPLLSTTPLKPPPGFSFDDRVSTEPHRPPQRPLPRTASEPPGFTFEDRVSTEPQRSSAWRVSYKDSRPTEPTQSSSTMTDPIAEPPVQPDKELTMPKTFVENVALYQKDLEDEFKEYEKELKSRERSQELEELDWQDLEDRYHKEISLKIADEEAIMREFQERFAVSCLD